MITNRDIHCERCGEFLCQRHNGDWIRYHSLLLMIYGRCVPVQCPKCHYITYIKKQFDSKAEVAYTDG